MFSLTKGERYEEPIRELGIDVVYAGKSRGRMTRMLKLQREMQRRGVTLVYSMHFFTNLYAAMVGRLLAVPEIGSMRNDCFSEIRAVGSLGKSSLKMPRVIAANSRLAMRNAESIGIDPQRLFFLPNVVDTARFQPKADTTPTGKVALVGRLTKQKRVDRMIDVVEELLRREVGLHCSIAGEGEERRKLEDLVRERSLEDAVTFIGNVNEIETVYHNIDVLCLTSEHEGTPNVALEAMACGVPVLATSVGGVPDIIQSGETGVLIDSYGTSAYADALQSLIEDHERRTALGEAARAYVESTHSPEALDAYLQELLERAQRKNAVD